MLPEISPYVTPFANKPNPGMFTPTPAIQNFTKRTVDQVKGFEGANAYQLAPDSSVIVIDSDQPLVWFIATDSSGNKTTVQGYKIEKYDPPKPVTLEDLMAEIKEMNERLMRVEGGANESYTQSSYEVKPVLAGAPAGRWAGGNEQKPNGAAE